MTDRSNLTCLDTPLVSERLFHPRPEVSGPGARPGSRDFLIPVTGGDVVGARFHGENREGPHILFFHGNGEIAADYDDLAPVYTGLGLNFIVTDYRGYGRSSGFPTVSAMLGDARDIFFFFRDFLARESFSGPLVVMGRSLGSASALEIAAAFQDRIDGLIIESGFARIVPLLHLVGATPIPPEITEKEDRFNLSRISTFEKPALIIHAEHDHIIPLSDGEALFAACPSREKSFLKIAGANHNDLFLLGFRAYMEAVFGLTRRLIASPSSG